MATSTYSTHSAGITERRLQIPEFHGVDFDQAAYIGLIECYCVNDQAAGGAGEAGALVGAVST